MNTQTITFRSCRLGDLSQLQEFVEELYAADANLKDYRPTVKLTFDEF